MFNQLLVDRLLGLLSYMSKHGWLRRKMLPVGYAAELVFGFLRVSTTWTTADVEFIAWLAENGHMRRKKITLGDAKDILDGFKAQPPTVYTVLMDEHLKKNL